LTPDRTGSLEFTQFDLRRSSSANSGRIVFDLAELGSD